jgi:AraC family transcriptional regulator
MAMRAHQFTVQETHGILLRAGNEIQAASDRHGWSSLYASVQREAPYEDSFAAVDDHLLILHLDGPVTVHRRLHHEQASRVIPPGGMFSMPGGMDFAVRLGGSLQTLHVYLRRGLVEEVAADIGRGDPAHVELVPIFGDGDQLIERLMLAIREVLENWDPSATAYVDYLVRAIAARLIREHSSSSAPLNTPYLRAKLGRGQLAKAIDFMEANLDRSIDLTAIAGAVGSSPSHFARQFRTAVGMAPHRYLMQLRTDRAKRLLTETAQPVAEIAFSCGFANQEHLTRLFKRFCGTTPAAFRKARRD